MHGISIVRRPQRWDQPFAGDRLTDAVVQKILQEPLFSDRVSPELLACDARIREPRHGEVVYRQGDYGTSAFYVLTGELRAIAGPVEIRPNPQRRRRIRSVMDLLRRPLRPEMRLAQADTSKPGSTPNCDLEDLVTRHSSGLLREKMLFGEIEALNRTPRAQSVVAASHETRILEIRWQGFRDLLQAHPDLRWQMDENMRLRTLRPFLKSIPNFRHLDPAVFGELVRTSTLETLGSRDWSMPWQAQENPKDEDIVVEEGAYAEDAIFVRAGFLRVRRRMQGGLRTINYLGANRSWVPDEEHSSAQLSVVGFATVVRVPRFWMKRTAIAGTSLRIPESLPEAPQIAPERLAFLTRERFINGTAVMAIHLDRCTRCDDCVRACADTHGGDPRFLRHGPQQAELMVTRACLHCQDPVCMIGCPTGAIYRREEGGTVCIDDPTCIGCGSCASNCPYEAIRMVEITDRAGQALEDDRGQPILKATKCDLCVDQPEGPACVRACPHNALLRIDMQKGDTLEAWLVS